MLPHLNPRDPCRTVFADMKILTMVPLYKYEVNCFATHKHNNKRLGEHHNTRNGNNDELSVHHWLKKKTSYMGPKPLNDMLLEHLKKIEEKKHVKKEVNKWFL